MDRKYFGGSGSAGVFVSTNFPIIVYDTTLRDGAQTHGICMGTDTKLEITQMLSDFGVQYIEGGFVDANPTDREYFRRVAALQPKSKIAVFGRTGADAEKMAGLKQYGMGVFTVVGNSSKRRVRSILKKDPAEYLRTIHDSVGTLSGAGEVVYDAEHFFSAFRDETDYAMKTLDAAAKHADMLVLCDTTGMMNYRDVEAVVEKVGKEFGIEKLGVHFHNDRGLALPCTMEAIKAGVRHVQGTMNGLGERCGNADIIELLGNLYEDGVVVWPKLEGCTKLAREISRLTGIPLSPNKPYAGRNAFAHSGGMHSDAMLKLWDAYQRLDPAIFGNKAWYPLSSQSGRAIIAAEARKYGFELRKEDDTVKEVLEEIHRMGEAGDAQFLSLLYSKMSRDSRIFRNVTRRIIDVAGRNSFSEATVKLTVKGKRFSEVSEGDGPVHAMDLAFKKALCHKYPDIGNVKLTDYEVHVIPGEHGGTASAIRVFAEFCMDGETFTSISKGEDILVASQSVLEDAYRFYLIKTRTK